MADITSANATFSLNVPDVFPIAVQLQGFATDDAFATEAVDVAETMMGVDGRMSAGYVPFIVPMRIMLQADSPSIAAMEQWATAEIQAQAKYFANGVILLPSVGRQYSLSQGALRRITPTPAVKKVLQPVEYEIHWAYWNSQPNILNGVTGLLSALGV